MEKRLIPEWVVGLGRNTQYEWMRLAQDIAGGIIIIILPSEKDYNNPQTGKYIDKYFKGKKGYSTED